MNLTKVAEFLDLFREFVPSYLRSFRGERYAHLHRSATTTGRGNYDMIAAERERGAIDTTRLLATLLPHADGPEARRAGAWIHYAPLISGEVREWFEGAGWINPMDWDDAASELVRFYGRLLGTGPADPADPTELETACRDMAALPFSAGFQSGLLSPLLHAVRPDLFTLVNNRSRWTLGYFLEEDLSHALADYPAANETAREAIDRLAPEMIAIAGSGEPAADILFDIFAHWLVAEKGFFKKPIPDPRDEHETVSLNRTDPADAAAALARLYPEHTPRRRSARLLADDIRLAHRLSPSNWEITLFDEKIRLNVGSTEVAVLYPNEIYMVIDADRLTRPEREVLADLFEISGEWYDDIPGTKGWGRIPASQLDDYLHLIGEPHRRFIEKASGGSTSAAWPDHHSTGVTAYLRDYLRRKIPDPDYIASGTSSNIEIPPLPDPEPPEEINPVEPEVEPEVEPTEPETPPTVAEEEPAYARQEDGTAPEEPEVHEIYTIEQCSLETGVDRETIERWLAAIDRKGQAILYGPPGTGKTYIAQRLARLIASGGNGLVRIVQFHPAYSYEDFVIGIRPQTREDGLLEYPLLPGRFVQFCRIAAERSGPSVMVIDEINRANVARVFGELMYLLEYRDVKIPLSGGSDFSIPGNVRIIGTMNSADRSIALVDHALRRRFAMIEIRPDYEVLRRFHEGGRHGVDPEGVVRLLRRVNEAIDDPHYEIGISFFLRPDLALHLRDIWTMEIEPYLAEYFFDRPGRAEEFRWARVRGDLDRAKDN